MSHGLDGGARFRLSTQEYDDILGPAAGPNSGRRPVPGGGRPGPRAAERAREFLSASGSPTRRRVMDRDSGVRALSGPVRAQIPRLWQTPGPCGVWTLDSGLWKLEWAAVVAGPLSPAPRPQTGPLDLRTAPLRPARRSRSSPARVTAATGSPRPSRLGLSLTKVSLSRALTPAVSRCVSRATMQAANHWHYQPTTGRSLVAEP